MCGGILEQVLCSHVGHIFRSRSPYAWRTGTNVLKKNSVRLAEVWLDDYKKYYFERLNFDLVRTDNVSDKGADFNQFPVGICMCCLLLNVRVVTCAILL